jgi:hypothetical protein
MNKRRQGIMITKEEVLANHKSHKKHLKMFNQGIDLFNSGVSCPIEQSPLRDGWICGEQMRAVRVAALEKSLNNAQV